MFSITNELHAVTQSQWNIGLHSCRDGTRAVQVRRNLRASLPLVRSTTPGQRLTWPELIQQPVGERRRSLYISIRSTEPLVPGNSQTTAFTSAATTTTTKLRLRWQCARSCDEILTRCLVRRWSWRECTTRSTQLHLPRRSNARRPASRCGQSARRPARGAIKRPPGAAELLRGALMAVVCRRRRFGKRLANQTALWISIGLSPFKSPSFSGRWCNRDRRQELIRPILRIHGNLTSMQNLFEPSRGKRLDAY